MPLISTAVKQDRTTPTAPVELLQPGASHGQHDGGGRPPALFQKFAVLYNGLAVDREGRPGYVETQRGV